VPLGFASREEGSARALTLFETNSAFVKFPFAFTKPRRVTPAARLMPWAGLLASSARLARAVASSAHSSPRSLRSLAQYSNLFLISRSKPRSGGL
jgi:hypothetical protein